MAVSNMAIDFSNFISRVKIVSQTLFVVFLSVSSFAQPILIKGPYLQIGTASSIILKWETNIPCNSKVAYGLNPNSLSLSVIDASVVTSHEVQITGLLPYTKYFYNIGTINFVIQGDTNNYFVTSPLAGKEGNYRFWVTGDCGNASVNQANCKNQYLNFNANKITDGWLLLGDNAYTSGTDAEYNSNFFSVYQSDIMKKAVLWPTPGNHDYTNGTVTNTNIPYYSIFNAPANAEAGGVASGTEAYYSFNYGNIHFISLDSYGTTGLNQKMYDTLSPQALWLKSDLAANNQLWTIAFWHHPPYTMGSHNSDTEQDLVTIRQDFVRLLERYNVDLIMCGHSHSYERSKLMKGHYGNEASFNSLQHQLDTSSALYDGSINSCPYMKDSLNRKSGTVYVVAGSAGQLGGQQTSFPHDAMFYSDANNGGSLVLDIEKNKLHGTWVCADGVIRDEFTIFKNAGKVKTYTVQPGQSLSLQASWPGSYLWNNGITNKTITVNSFSNSTYWVKDNFSCVTDTFKLNVLPAVNFSNTGIHCAGQTIQFFDFSTNNPISWLWGVQPNAGVNINNVNAQNPQVFFLSPTIYTVSLVASNLSGPGTIYYQTLSIYPRPFVLYNNSGTSICKGESIILQASGAPNYTWSNGATGPNAVVAPSLTTVYTTTFSNNYGCTSTGSIPVIVNTCSGINANSETTESIPYPNPIETELFYNYNYSGKGALKIMDMRGVIIQENEIKEGFNKLDCFFSPGIYDCKIIRNGEVIYQGKLLKY